MEHYPVVVVGAGPTGLTLANLLGRYGVRCLLVERNHSTVAEPRAVSIDDESLRTMQAAGVIDTVLRDIVPGYGSIYYTPSGKIFAKVEPGGKPFGYPKRNAFRQPRLEAQLRNALEGHSNVSVQFGWNVESFEQLQNCVTLQLKSAQGQHLEVSADYVVGCDGAASTVRTHLGIILEGTTYAKRWLIVDLENNENYTRQTEVFCDPRRPCITLPGPNNTRRYEFELLPDETDDEMLAPQRVASLLASHGADPAAEIKRTAVYRFHARVAPKWSVGRVFLAGDAAHLTPPFAGQGMNSGIRDAQNLAWKLAAVLKGQLGVALLDTYELERRDHAWQMIRLALHMGTVMSPRSWLSATVTQTLFRILNFIPAARSYISEMKYKPKPKFSDGFKLDEIPELGGRIVGRMLPQPTVLTAKSERLLLDDIIGSRFALIVRTTDAEATFSHLHQPVWDQLDVVRVAIAPVGATLKKSSGVIVVAECDDLFSTQLTNEGSHAFLLRPDRYVAASFPLWHAAEAARDVENLIRSTRISRMDGVTT